MRAAAGLFDDQVDEGVEGLAGALLRRAAVRRRAKMAPIVGPTNASQGCEQALFLVA